MSDKVLIDRSELVNIADAIRTKTGTADQIQVNELDARIAMISGEGGVTLPTLTNEGEAADLLEGKELIGSDGAKVVGTMATNDEEDVVVSGATVITAAGYYADDVSKSVATVEQATPSISVDSFGLVTAIAMQDEGYVAAGSKGATKQLATQGAKTVVPGETEQVAVAAGVYTTGAVTVAAIPSQYITTTDATAAADEIFSGETAYVNGAKVTGTFTIDSEVSTNTDLISQIQSALTAKGY